VVVQSNMYYLLINWETAQFLLPCILLIAGCGVFDSKEDLQWPWMVINYLAVLITVNNGD